MGLRKLLERIFCSKLLRELEVLKKQQERFLPTFRFTHTKPVAELGRALKVAFPTLKLAQIADVSYDAFLWDELKEWLNKDSLSEMRWIEDIQDCDDFAMESVCRMKILSRFQKKNFAYGEAWGYTPMGYHAFCIAYVIKDNSKQMIVIEPQNDDTRMWSQSDYKPEYVRI